MAVQSPVRSQRDAAAPLASSAHRPHFWLSIAGGDLLAFVMATLVTGMITWLTVAHAAIAMLALAAAGTQRPRLDPRVVDDLPRLAAALASPVLLLGPIAAWLHEISYLTLWVPAATGVVLVSRAVVCARIRRARGRREVADATVIVGCGDRGERLARNLQEHPELGLLPIGFLDHVPPLRSDLPLLGAPGDLERLLRAGSVQRVIVAFGVVSEADMVAVLRACDGSPVEVHVLPRLFELGVGEGPDHDDAWGVPLIRLPRQAFRSLAWRSKRVGDVVVAALMLVLLSPVLGLVALAVALSSPGPILFRQQRIGEGGRPLELLKFRTMRVNADSDTTWNVKDDDRMTRVGKILRATSLDEIPQLWNVVRGDMSLVGPRPERERFAHRFLVSIPRYGDRHRVPLGITGWAQVHGLRGDTSIEERAEFDNRYVESWSVWRDVSILWRTVGSVFRREGG